MEHLVLKVGNSHLVAALFKDDIIIDKIRLPYEESWHLKLEDIINKYPAISSAFIGSVNSKVDKELAIALSSIDKKFKIPLNDLSINFAVDNKAEVGSDIIANCYGALKLYPQTDIIVVDMGTAATLTAIDKNRNFLGVSILPGIEMSAKSLNIMTDMLPDVDLNKPPRVLGKNTVHCIQSGLYYGLIGSVSYLLELIINENFKEKPLIIATGGLTAPVNYHSGFIPKTPIAKSLQKDILNQIPDLKIVHDLTLIGMYEILKEQLH
jgi:type III pantothenate kinase